METLDPYLSTTEQHRLIEKLAVITSNAPLKEKIFYQHGDKFCCGLLFASGLIFWRCGWRAFGLHRYTRGRISTLLLSSTSCINGTLAHTLAVHKPLNDYYRKENMWYYGMRSAIGHQFGLVMGFLFGSGITFLVAQRFGIIPVPDQFMKAGNRQIAFNYFITKIKPYTRTMVVTSLTTTSLMFVLGLIEYKQSSNLLAKLNRKTLCMRED